MEKSFVDFSEDPNFHFAYGAAVRLSGKTIAENSKFDNLAEKANNLGQQAIISNERYLTEHVGSVVLVAVPAFFGKNRRLLEPL